MLCCPFGESCAIEGQALQYNTAEKNACRGLAPPAAGAPRTAAVMRRSGRSAAVMVWRCGTDAAALHAYLRGDGYGGGHRGGSVEAGAERTFCIMAGEMYWP